MRRHDETTLLNLLLIRCSALGARLWRNNVGALQDRHGQWIRYGVANPGGSDLIGYLPVTIGSEHIGRTLAVFVAFEAKTATGRLRPDQQHFLRVASDHGAIAAVVRSLSDAETTLAPWLR